MATKVSQATIDKIKAMGMTAALKKANTASPEMREGLKRMYGAKRVLAATKNAPSKPVAKSPDEARGVVKKAAVTKPVAKSADAARSAATPVVSKAPTKKVNTTSNPATAAFNKLSPYGNKDQKYVSGLPKEGLAGRKSVPGKPSVGEKITAAVTGKGIGNRPSATSVAATNAKRMGISVAEYNKRLAAAKKK